MNPLNHHVSITRRVRRLGSGILPAYHNYCRIRNLHSRLAQMMANSNINDQQLFLFMNAYNVDLGNSPLAHCKRPLVKALQHNRSKAVIHALLNRGAKVTSPEHSFQPLEVGVKHGCSEGILRAIWQKGGHVSYRLLDMMKHLDPEELKYSKAFRQEVMNAISQHTIERLGWLGV